MAQKQKCILCHIVYNSKKDMNEHLRSMLHHRELENLKGRDSNHECRVCRVTVVGLSAYAKHISSQLHKDNADAHDRVQEEGKEEADEEYVDKELIQLIKQRKQQSWQEEACNTNNELETHEKRLQKRKEDQGAYQDRGSYDQSTWHRHGPPQRNWKWEHGGFINYRQSNFPHSAHMSIPSGHLNGPKGQTGWHLNGPGSPANQPKPHSGVGNIWHSNRGGSSSWHHGGTGRVSNWHLEGTGIFPIWHSNRFGKNWNLNSNPRGGNGWNNGFPPGRNRTLNPPITEDLALWWKNKNGKPNNLKGYTWEWQDNGSTNIVPPYRVPAVDQSEKIPCRIDFTNDLFPSECALDFNVPQKLKDRMSKCSGKSSSPSREKYRWAPYPFQKTTESQSAAKEADLQDSESEQSSVDLQSPLRVGDQKLDNTTVLPKQKMRDYLSESIDSKAITDFTNFNKVVSDCPVGGKPDQDKSKISRMSSLTMHDVVSNMKSSAPDQDPKNLFKNVKLVSPSLGNGQNNLRALDLDTNRSRSYDSKLHSASSQSESTFETTQKEPVETLTEVLKKAKEMLQYSQHLHSQHLSSHTSNRKLLQKSCSIDEPLTNSAKAYEQKTNAFEDVSDGECASSENNGATAENSGLCNNDYSSSTSPHSKHSTKNEEEIITGASDHFPNNSDIASSPPQNSTSILTSAQYNPEANIKASQQGGHEDSVKPEANLETVGFENSGFDLDLQKEGGQSSGSLLPELSKFGLPASLQRDLTRHIGSKSKVGAHLPEPNLNNARRIRNVNCYRKSEMDKESGLKPTLRQILNASRRNVNWDQVIQQVTKKKQELEKGLPRFGIEMIAPVQNDQEELYLNGQPDLSSLEGFHWEGISVLPPGPVRKRSLSESSVVVDRSASVYGLFSEQTTGQERERRQITPTGQPFGVPLKTNGNSEVSGLEQEEKVEGSACVTNRWLYSTHSSTDALTITATKQEKDLQKCKHPDKESILEDQREKHGLDQSGTAPFTSSILGDAATDSSCTSGAEQNDIQGIGKKRRATVDGGSPEIPSLERKNKRRKLKGKKERSQVDQLLNISLREEELSKSLQGVDSNLLQARATLQAAYVEVQSLLVLKQQITVEMSGLRTQRIQILQGMQETYDPTEHTEQPSDSISGERRSNKLQTTVDLSSGHFFSLLLEAPPHHSLLMPPSSTKLGTSLRVSTPPAFQATGSVTTTTPDSSVMIKQEPMPSEQGDESMNTAPYNSVCAPSATSLQANELSQNPSLYPVITSTRSLTELAQSFPQVSCKFAPGKGGPKSSENNFPSQLPFSSKREENSTLNQGILSERHSSTFQTHFSTMQELLGKMPCPLPAQQAESTLATSESQGGKKKKKLRKKKTLRATRVPENSDTEHDTDANKPTRKVKSKRIPKDVKVTTSTLLEQENGSTMLGTENNKDENDSDCVVEVVEISNAQFEVVAIDSGSGDEKPDSPSKQDLLSNREMVHCSYDEVTSTSEMGSSYKDGVRTSVAGTQTSISSISGTKNCSEVSSEPGDEEDPTEGIFEGHQAAVNAIQIFGGLLYTCSADKTVRAYSLVSRKCVGTFEGHTSKVNCLLVTQAHGKDAVLYTGSSDHTIRCYNVKTREYMEQLKLADRVLCLHSRWRILYAGLANGTVVTFSIKSNKQLDIFECHSPRAISCLATAQEGARRLLMVGSYDCTISVRDARNGLLLRTLEGHSKTVLCMKVVNDLVFSGSSDQSVHAHNIHTGELIRIYKGHSHAVTVVNILGKVMVTACLDKFVRIYELQSHDRLQVYGGHTDMIMCMAIHKSMIYTGCYDGSVQAVRLNLMQNYRCWWHGCFLIFGVVDHLKQHLLTDHTNPNFQTLKCRWKSCDAFFTNRRGCKQDAVDHIERHAEDDSKMNT
ncbi:zinc finger protein 106 isoform X2 [Rhinatrema bivittatum]|uniref:zinc finger protein 106 isoform X2 n=1 Tax=Rhinatrema bivittatum TaxID=194408 RepID=UPI001126FCA8|nr:zinc finger protein 106 isoform X2 [Rhinatrema bivittatum]